MHLQMMTDQLSRKVFNITLKVLEILDFPFSISTPITTPSLPQLTKQHLIHLAFQAGEKSSLILLFH